MSMLKLRIVNANQAVEEVALDQAVVIQVESGATYSVVDAETGEVISDVVVKREGDSLVIEKESEKIVEIEEYFNETAAYFDVGGAGLVTPESPVAEGSNLVWSAEQGAEGLSSSASSAGVLGGLALGGLGIAGGSSSSSSASGTDAGTDAGTDTGTDTGTDSGSGEVEILVVGGPVINADELWATFYKEDGTILSENFVGAGGALRIDAGNYTGIVSVRVTNVDSDPDYLDEATGTQKDIGDAEFWADGIKIENGRAFLNVNIFSTLSHFKALEAGDGVLTEENVAESNAAVAEAFGLGDLHAEDIQTTVDADGNASEANAYGEALALMSVLDAKNGGDISASLNALIDGTNLVSGGGIVYSDALKTELLEVKDAVAAIVADAENGTSTAPQWAGNLAGLNHADTLAAINARAEGVQDAVAAANDKVAEKLGSPVTFADTTGPRVKISSAVDADTGEVTLTYKFSEDVTGFTADNITIANAVKGGFSESNASTYTLVVTPAADTDGSFTATTEVSGVEDAAGNTAYAPPVFVQKFAFAEAPEFLDGAVAAVEFPDGGSGAAYTPDADDNVGITAFSFAGGADDGLFTIDSDTGAVSFKAAPDLSSPGSAESSNDYVVKIQAEDAAGNTAVQTVTISIVEFSLSLALEADTGAADDDGITMNGNIAVSGLSDGAEWEYSVNSGTDWSTGSGTLFSLIDGEYDADTIQVRQVGAESVVATNSSKIVVDLMYPDAPTVTVGRYGTVDVSGIEEGATWYYWDLSSEFGGWVEGTGTSFDIPIGSWSATDLKVRQQDVAGNISINANAASSFDVVAPPVLTLSLGTDTGSVNSDFITNDGTMNVTGLEDGATWEYSIDAGANWADGADGAFVLTDGQYAIGDIQIRQKDLPTNLVKNTTPIEVDSAKPTVGLFTVSDKNGELDADATTNYGVLTLAGAGEDGSTVEVFNGEVSLGEATVTGQAWTLNVDVPDGLLAITVVETDLAGNESDPSSQFGLTVDAPRPVVTAVVDSVGRYTDNLDSGAITDDPNLVFEGTAPEGTTAIKVYINGSLVGSASPVLDGTTWTYEAPRLAEETIEGAPHVGYHEISFAAVIDGEESAKSDPFDWGMDETEPGQAVIKEISHTANGEAFIIQTNGGAVVLDPNGEKTTAGNGITLGGTLNKMWGYLDEGLTIDVYLNDVLQDQDVTGNVVITGEDWTYTYTGDPLANGESYNFSFVAVDAAGNESLPSQVVMVSDTVAPTVTAESYGTFDWGGGDTKAFHAVVTGGADTVGFEFSLNGTPIAVSYLSGMTNAYYDAGTGDLYVYETSFRDYIVDGDNVFKIQAVDYAGNLSLADEATVTLDFTGPGMAADAAIVDAAGVSPHAVVIDFNEKVNVDNFTAFKVVADGSLLGYVPATAILSEDQMSVQFFFSTALPANANIRFILATEGERGQITDIFGNILELNRETYWGVDFTTGDADTTDPVIAIESVSGDNYINASEASSDVVVKGTTDAEDGQVVTVEWKDGDTVLATQTATVASGAWSATFASTDLPTTDGTTTVTANVSDIAGNSATPATKDVELDTVAPTTATTIDSVVSGGSAVASDGTAGTPAIAASSTVTVSGSGVTTGEGSVVKIYDGSSELAEAVVDGNGDWSVDFSLTADATNALTAVVEDSAGNATAASETFYVSPPPPPHAGTTAVVFDYTTGYVSGENTTEDRTFSADESYTIYMVVDAANDGTLTPINFWLSDDPNPAPGTADLQVKWIGASNLSDDDQIVIVSSTGAAISRSGQVSDGVVHTQYGWLWGGSSLVTSRSAGVWLMNVQQGKLKVGSTQIQGGALGYTSGNIYSGMKVDVAIGYDISEIWNGSALV